VKNQYFGDINDYRKYGLLRILTDSGTISSAGCWMLTPGDNSGDGKLTEYLNQPGKYRKFDQDLFDRLKTCANNHTKRDVSLAESVEIIPNAVYYDKVLSDARSSRFIYFDSFFEIARKCNLIFFDPDNGMEVKSIEKGNKDSSKYLYWDEIIRAFDKNHSILVYQHFPHINRDCFTSCMVNKFHSKAGINRVFSFRTSNVVFFLLPIESHLAFFEKQITVLKTKWHNQIIPQSHNAEGFDEYFLESHKDA
jgi:hypothetical protein